MKKTKIPKSDNLNRHVILIRSRFAENLILSYSIHYELLAQLLKETNIFVDHRKPAQL